MVSSEKRRQSQFCYNCGYNEPVNGNGMCSVCGVNPMHNPVTAQAVRKALAQNILAEIDDPKRDESDIFCAGELSGLRLALKIVRYTRKL